ncbi:hypothetical protein MC885_018027 [Smutsia gigantea]|nr:hypothetical protein MC885_018027 [Smutsia gigantea]
MLPPAAAQGGMRRRVKGGEPRPSGARRKLRPRFPAPESAGIFRLPRTLQASEASQASSDTPLSRQQTPAPEFLSPPLPDPPPPPPPPGF